MASCRCNASGTDVIVFITLRQERGKEKGCERFVDDGSGKAVSIQKQRTRESNRCGLASDPGSAILLRFSTKVAKCKG